MRFSNKTMSEAMIKSWLEQYENVLYWKNSMSKLVDQHDKANRPA